MAHLRRSNKSHKVRQRGVPNRYMSCLKPAQVPNVKLRPALASSNPKARQNPSHDSGFESENENSIVDTCPRPFRDVVLCATGINDKVCEFQPWTPTDTLIPYLLPKTTIFKQAFELGAQPLSDLTDKVTHLLAVEPGSAKYKVHICSQCHISFLTVV